MSQPLSPAAPTPAPVPVPVPVPVPRPRHRPWSLTLIVLHSLGIAVGVGFAVVGVWAVMYDLTRENPDELWFGPWGLIFGALLLAVALALVIPAGVLLVLTIVGRRRADQGRPTMLRVVAIIGLVLALILLVLGVVGVVEEPDAVARWLPVILPLGYAAVAGSMLRALAARPQEP